MGDIPTLTITDKPCPRCGKKGATGEEGKGLCLECAVEKLKRMGGTMDINEQALRIIEREIKIKFDAHQHLLDRAFKAHGDQPFDIGLKVRLEVDGGLLIETEISYKNEPPMKDKSRVRVNPDQLIMFPESENLDALEG